MSPAQQLQALMERSIDVGFTRAIPTQYRDTIASELLYSDPLVAVVPREGFPHSHSIDLRTLADRKFVFYHGEGAPQLFDAILALCKKAGFAPRIASTPDTIQAVLTLVEAGEGVALLPGCIRLLQTKGIRFCKVTPHSECADFVMAWRRQKDTVVRDTFVELVRDKKKHISGVMQSE
jgi:DNA-binding transcriptional LysR family regulator